MKDEIEVAYENSRRVIDFEQALGIFNEVDLQANILTSDATIWLLNRYYFYAHFLGTAIWVVWMYVRHYDHYGRVRRVLVGTTFSALAIHVAFPLAPPRWFPDMGFVDTLQTYGPKIYDAEAIANTANQIAAMPSLHVGWALIGAWAIVKASTNRWRWIAAIHPAIMTAAVVLTANHWWLDAIIAAVLVSAIAAADAPVQRWLERRKPAELDVDLTREISGARADEGDDRSCDDHCGDPVSVG
ncbi:MAG: phosphatase PAP2 family protein [Actinomycetota bacterium]